MPSMNIVRWCSVQVAAASGLVAVQLEPTVIKTDTFWE
jgi:hypothetical protein